MYGCLKSILMRKEIVAIWTNTASAAGERGDASRSDGRSVVRSFGRSGGLTYRPGG